MGGSGVGYGKVLNDEECFIILEDDTAQEVYPNSDQFILDGVVIYGGKIVLETITNVYGESENGEICLEDGGAIVSEDFEVDEDREILIILEDSDQRADEIILNEDEGKILLDGTIASDGGTILIDGQVTAGGIILIEGLEVFNNITLQDQTVSGDTGDTQGVLLLEDGITSLATEEYDVTAVTDTIVFEDLDGNLLTEDYAVEDVSGDLTLEDMDGAIVTEDFEVTSEDEGTSIASE